MDCNDPHERLWARQIASCGFKWIPGIPHERLWARKSRRLDFNGFPADQILVYLDQLCRKWTMEVEGEERKVDLCSPWAPPDRIVCVACWSGPQLISAAVA